MPNPSHTALDVIRNEALRLDGDEHDYDALLDSVGGRSLVLLGEATHGTREFYRMRAELTLRLVVEQGFDAIAVEADWPDAYRLNLFVRGEGHDQSARSAFDDFQRFPRWMWRNEEVLRFVERLRDINMTRQASERIGFYGLDMYSMYRSANAVVDYLSTVDEEQAAIARKQYAALDHVRDPQRYGYEAVLGLRPDCREGVRQRLLDLWTLAPEYLSADGRGAVDAYFFAERNAHVVASAESYYRAMFGSRAASWNVRDEHMVQTLFALQAHLRALGSAGKVVVWAHNSHLGDARATEMSRAGEWNVGQLVRERAGAEAAWLVGFTTYTGTVTAAYEWDGEAECRQVKVARPDSYEDLFHRTRLDRFYLPMQEEAARVLREPLLERAIGVLYRPDTEYESHYFKASIAAQFDAVFHLDETSAVEPLDTAASRREMQPV
ncbi:erythromycin esterase family protein [Rhodanobacter sp. T12-5]|uniref:erythromycin esterase family protein n=1 Tax=Rhodanobacter sp. T12-5 TaxID=2024611 RepID=UPI0011F07DC1|nr:erythromycin esterase family protein [Rhodanobacter sp. T12-5]KAA0068342.1 erythromycin esterase family protein [Rhodanobacter sp. T12-5]